MAYLRLVPHERSSVASVRYGGITRARATTRLLLIEASCTYRFPGPDKLGVVALAGGPAQAHPQDHREGAALTGVADASSLEKNAQ
jgi:transposase